MTFLSGDAVGTTQCMNITIIDDSAVEFSEQFFVSLDTNDPAALLDPIAQTTVVIEDSDGELTKIIHMLSIELFHCLIIV